MIDMFEKKSSQAFAGASWSALAVGSIGYIAGLWNSDAMELNEKGFYLIALLFGLFAAVSVQKSVRDRLENIPVSNMYYGICWAALIVSGLLMGIGLFNAESLELNEKGFFLMSFSLALFASVAIQKNTRDALADEKS